MELFNYIDTNKFYITNVNTISSTSQNGKIYYKEIPSKIVQRKIKE